MSDTHLPVTSADAPLLSLLYTAGTLRPTPSGARFEIKNRFLDASLSAVRRVAVDGTEVPLADILLRTADGDHRADSITPDQPLPLPVRARIEVRLEGVTVGEGRHEIDIAFAADPFGDLAFTVADTGHEDHEDDRPRVPRDPDDDFSPEAAEARRRFATDRTGVTLDHVGAYSFDPHATQGNIEHFTGVAQIPLGLAGPLHVRGEHADGEYLIPLATTEGTLVASYNRGMKVVNQSGGAICTVQDDSMQRAPVFTFASAREARDFRTWVEAHTDEIAAAAEATTSVGRLQYIDTFLASRFAFLRFNFSTGDAAGQNMVGRATFAACSWILEQRDDVRRFYLEANLATDKKASHVNMMRTRGKRVTAEVTIPRRVLSRVMRVEPESLHHHFGIANVGSFLAGVNNNGLHSPNGITAMFIATGQDVANVAESSAAVVHAELTPDRSLYFSITIPSLIVASYGGGTSLPTQHECLEMLGCAGPGGVRKLAEIVAAVVLAGEISLASAISSLDWVSSHEHHGRNR